MANTYTYINSKLVHANETNLSSPTIAICEISQVNGLQSKINKLNNLGISDINSLQAQLTSITNMLNELNTRITALENNTTPVEPEPTNQNTWYLGETAITSDEELTSKDQSYFDGLEYNQLTKPNNGDQIQLHTGYNVVIIPEIWGVPVVAQDSDFTFKFTPYKASDLNDYGMNVSNPSGKLLLVYEMTIDRNAYIKWE